MEVVNKTSTPLDAYAQKGTYEHTKGEVAIIKPGETGTVTGPCISQNAEKKSYANITGRIIIQEEPGNKDEGCFQIEGFSTKIQIEGSKTFFMVQRSYN